MLAKDEADVFTPELLEMLSHIVLTSAPELSPSADGQASSRAVCAPVVVSETSVSSWDRGVSYETATHTISPSSESIESAETTETQGFRPLSPHNMGNPYGHRHQSSTGYRTSEFYGRAPAMLNASPTTLMMKNIPNRVTREELADEIMARMPAGSFDFLYLPIDFKSRAGFGYAFINCTGEAEVDLFVEQFHKSRLACTTGTYTKPIEVTVARVQGFTANINRLISSPVLFSADEGSLPLIFNGSQQTVPFKALMQLNRASILFQTRPSIEELMHMVEVEFGTSSSDAPGF